MVLRRSNRIPLTLALVLVLATVVCLFRTGIVFSQEEVEDTRQYTVYGVYDQIQRTEIANTGAAIDAVGGDWVGISANPEEVTAIEVLGYRVEPAPFQSGAPKFQTYLPMLMDSSPVEVDDVRQYRVYGVSDKYQRTEIARTGAAIDAVGSDWVEITAILKEIAAVEALGYEVELLPPPVQIHDFPPEDSDYHDYAEMVTEIDQAVADHPHLIDVFSVGQSYEGRIIRSVKISDNPGLDEPEPEVLFHVHQHAREHLAVEQGLYILHLLTDEYAITPQITNLVNSREIYILFDVNPDGGEYDHSGSSYYNWRKNRQPNAGSSAIGTDLNRNWGYKWGCCGGSSGDPSSTTYRGSYPFSAPETDAVRSFVDSRVLGGEQQITVAIDLHTYGELVLWPYGYTYEDVPPDMTLDDHDVLVTMGQDMALLSGYGAEQSADWYIVDGTFIDWMYGVHGVFSFGFELYPRTGHGGFYPSDAVIPDQTARNRDAILYLLELADCPYRAIGKESEYCSVVPAPTTLISPSGPNTETTPTYTWEVVSAATKYRLVVKGPLGTVIKRTYKASNVCDGSAGTCAVTPPTELGEGEHTWRVKTINSYGSTWSDWMDFTVGPAVPPGPATLISPSGASTDTTPTYTWEVVPTATKYRLVVKDSLATVLKATYRASKVCDGSAGTCAVTPPTELAAGEHTWRVKSLNSYGSTWSIWLDFTVSSSATSQADAQSTPGLSGDTYRLYLPLVAKPAGPAEPLESP
jgi:carboxypeptidase T